VARRAAARSQTRWRRVLPAALLVAAAVAARGLPEKVGWMVGRVMMLERGEAGELAAVAAVQAAGTVVRPAKEGAAVACKEGRQAVRVVVPTAEPTAAAAAVAMEAAPGEAPEASTAATLEEAMVQAKGAAKGTEGVEGALPAGGLAVLPVD